MELQIDFQATAWVEGVMLVDERPWYYGSHNLHRGNLKEQFAENRGSIDSLTSEIDPSRKSRLRVSTAPEFNQKKYARM